MSLRDQLLNKGLASSKDAKRVGRELKQSRKAKQGKRKKQSAVQREQQQTAREQQQAMLAARAKARLAREQAAEAALTRQRVLDMAKSHAIRSRGPVVMYHRALHGPQLMRIQVSQAVAHTLRCGEAAIVGTQASKKGSVNYWIVSKKAAARIEEIDPQAVVFWTRDTSGISSPEAAFLQPTWEGGFGGRRVSNDQARAWLADRAAAKPPS